jgi:hypothetical protein
MGRSQLSMLGIVASLLVVGCSNEILNAAFYSTEDRLRKFREYHDREIGEHYVGILSEVCSRRSCATGKDGMLEISHESVFEEDCDIVWIVEPSETGKYHHPTNGLTLNCVGTKRSWRYASDPNHCLFGLDWEGPW